MKYGRWTVVGDKVSKNGRSHILCKCKCGTERLVSLQSLERGLSTSCGCLKNEKLSQRSKRLVKDIAGERFGRLVVQHRDYVAQESRKSKSAYWVCKCDCGVMKTIQGSSMLKNNGTRSCGCLAKELSGKRGRLLNTKPRGEASFNSLFYHYKHRAKKYGRSFSLTKTQFRKLIKGNCLYCGAPPNNVVKNRCNTGDLVYSGIDRIDAAKGYEPDNCVSCCHVCNRAKSDLSVQEFVEWIKRVGDATTDKTFAKRAGFKFSWAEDFFKKTKFLPI